MEGVPHVNGGSPQVPWHSRPATASMALQTRQRLGACQRHRQRSFEMAVNISGVHDQSLSALFLVDKKSKCSDTSASWKNGRHSSLPRPGPGRVQGIVPPITTRTLSAEARGGRTAMPKRSESCVVPRTTLQKRANGLMSASDRPTALPRTAPRIPSLEVSCTSPVSMSTLDGW